jgi:ATP-dependent RNA helicase DeaD
MKDHPELPKAFADLGLDISLLKGIHKAGFEKPSDIQRELIPHIMAGRDVLGQAKTGTGKTASFGLPLMHLINPDGKLQGLILVPTRELAAQVTAEIRRLGEFTPFTTVPVYGGQSIRHQIAVLGRKTHIIVATPGRMLDLMGRGVVELSSITQVVLDEVDRMLDIGFIDDIRRVLRTIKQEHQTVFVSATLSDEVKKLATQFLNDPVEINVSRDELTVDNVEQGYCTVDPWDKYRLLRLLLKQETPTLAIVFTNTKHGARKLAKKLHADGLNVKEIHGDLVQRKREKVMERFRRHKIQVLVATDLAARGIDVQDISHIINYDLPQDSQIYVHRIGRTARMGAFGRAVTFVTREEGNELTKIEMLINTEIPAIEYEGFVPRPPREQEQPVDDSKARWDAPIFGAGVNEGEAPKVMPQRTLGSKFPTRRRRR